ncbi:hypothetical protein B0H66DRAFT_449385, partial [Apodospora peruviana]
MYWMGVRRELTHAIRTIKAWRDIDSTLEDDGLEDEEQEVEISGFDTFLDSVSESSREFAVQYATEKSRRMQRTARGEFVPYDSVLKSIARSLYASEKSRALKKDIHLALSDRVLERDKFKRRARMLLQSAGWLDMDKFIEHRPPLDEVGFWKKPSPPQLSLLKFDQNNCPVFQLARCALCREIIRGSMFRCTVPDCTEDGHEGVICQGCQHDGKHTNAHLTKEYKHCVLEENIDLATSRQLCRCNTVARFNNDGQPRKLFPVLKADDHRSTKKGGVSCCLLNLPNAVAEAKYDGVLMKPQHTTLGNERAEAEETARRLEEKRKKQAKDSSYNQIATETINEKKAKDDIPFFMRNVTDRYPFGNVHMALRIGPLMIENGVPDTKGGAYITSRDPPNWQVAYTSGGVDIEYSLALNDDPTTTETRVLYRSRRSPRHPKRYKTALKQVVGGLFTGYTLEALENTVIDQVMAASGIDDLDNADDHITVREQIWNSTLAPILANLHALMDDRVNVLLPSITQRLLDRNIPLKWNRRTNNCQNFCDNMIDYPLYGSFLSSSAGSYLMSFICRPGAYTPHRERNVQTKYDVPSGLCEEYLLKFRYGLHVESDIVDSLLEYWHDWGAFCGGPIYPSHHQNLFPWDCTEAYRRETTRKTCGSGCTLSKHVWSFPFDSWSISELHLARGYGALMYPEVVSPKDWMRNRLSILRGQDALLAGAATMARSKLFRQAVSWMSLCDDPRVDRFKLGGIHRAQPFSHHYEEGKYHEYFVADWAHLCRDDQVKEYEAIRDARRELPDIPDRKDDLGSYGG